MMLKGGGETIRLAPAGLGMARVRSDALDVLVVSFEGAADAKTLPSPTLRATVPDFSYDACTLCSVYTCCCSLITPKIPRHLFSVLRSPSFTRTALCATGRPQASPQLRAPVTCTPHVTHHKVLACYYVSMSMPRSSVVSRVA